MEANNKLTIEQAFDKIREQEEEIKRLNDMTEVLNSACKSLMGVPDSDRCREIWKQLNIASSNLQQDKALAALGRAYCLRSQIKTSEDAYEGFDVDAIDNKFNALMAAKFGNLKHLLGAEMLYMEGQRRGECPDKWFFRQARNAFDQRLQYVSYAADLGLPTDQAAASLIEDLRKTLDFNRGVM